MNVDLLFQIASIGIIVAVLNQILNKAERSEYALMVTLVGLVIVLLLVVNEISSLFEVIQNLVGI